MLSQLLTPLKCFFSIADRSAVSRITFLDSSLNSIFQWLTNFSNFWCAIGFGFDKICATLSSIYFWFGTLLYERKKNVLDYDVKVLLDCPFITTNKLTSCHFGNIRPYVTFILIFNFKMNKWKKIFKKIQNNKIKAKAKQKKKRKWKKEAKSFFRLAAFVHHSCHNIFNKKSVIRLQKSC